MLVATALMLQWDWDPRPVAGGGTPAAESAMEDAADRAYSADMPGLSLSRWLAGRTTRVPPGLDIKATDRHFAIYYGWPSAVNGVGGEAEAAATFARFPVVILGDGLQHPTHPDHPRTAGILQRLRDADVRVFGYVDLGVSTQNLPLATLIRYAEAWRRIGARGIFLDDAGADFGVDVARRDGAVSGIHRLGMRVILNAHDPDDAFRGSAQLGTGDGYLFESFQVSDGRLQSPEISLAKADRALELARPAGVDVYAVGTGPPDDPGFASKHDYAWWSTLLYGFDYFQYTTIDYSARTGQLRWYPQELPELGARYLEETVRHSWAEGVHRRLTDRGELRLATGSGSGGTFVPREAAPTQNETQEP